MKKLFFFPQYAKGKASNPYCDNYVDSIKDDFVIVSKMNNSIPRGLELLIGSTKADIYIINWLEGISSLKGGAIQAMMGILSLLIIKMRRKIIVWMFHNIHPHDGENFWSKKTQEILFKWSSIIISHSKEASSYAKQYAKCPVYYKPHPIKKKEYGEWNGTIRECDFYIWGDIYPYKGVVELLESIQRNSIKANVLIIGRPTNDNIKKQIESKLSNNVLFENRRPCFEEIAAQCKKSKYVVFPYVGNSISSSGGLMDTLLMGGVPVGPNKGAFADLALLGCCITYNNVEEIFNLPCNDGYRILLRESDVEDFIHNNSWDSYGEWFKIVIENHLE